MRYITSIVSDNKRQEEWFQFVSTSSEGMEHLNWLITLLTKLKIYFKLVFSSETAVRIILCMCSGDIIEDTHYRVFNPLVDKLLLCGHF